MNLEDVIDPEYGLQQDDWSLSGVVFGTHGQLSVVGWSGKRKSDKFYILRCSVCSQDPELFGEGIFRSFKFSLLKKHPQIPCGCSARVAWTEEQYKVLCIRKLRNMGLEFIGWEGAYRKAQTKVIVSCPTHGLFTGANVKAFVDQETTKGNCVKCGNSIASKTRSKSIDYFTQMFSDSGNYSKDHKFEFIGYCEGTSKRLWNVWCPVCNVDYEASTGSITEGKKGCGCNYKDKHHAYINKVYYNGELVCLKFGISYNAIARNKTINNRTNCNVILDTVYQFERSSDCYLAEKECKVTLLCGVISQDILPDGYTETTTIENYEKIEEIYKKFNGWRLTSLESACML